MLLQGEAAPPTARRACCRSRALPARPVAACEPAAAGPVHEAAAPRRRALLLGAALGTVVALQAPPGPAHAAPSPPVDRSGYEYMPGLAKSDYGKASRVVCAWRDFPHPLTQRRVALP